MYYKILNREEQIKKILKVCDYTHDQIIKHKEEIVDELLNYESYETVVDEIWRSLDCLRNIAKEMKYLQYGKVSLLCTFFPINLPLYSFVLFALIPGFTADEVVVRPPNLMFKTLKKICSIINIFEVMPHIQLLNLERNLFLEAYVSVADVILFTGKYENAKIVQDVCPNALLIFNGAGVNPVLVTDSADLSFAIKKVVEMRTFNSGQDCAGSDAILIHKKIAKQFIMGLLEELNKIQVGDYRDKKTKVGKIVKTDQMIFLEKFLSLNFDKIIYGGRLDFDRGIVNPTVLVEELQNVKEIKYTEFFAPIFYLLIYHNNKELKRYFSGNYKNNAMYASVFGAKVHKSLIPKSIIIMNKIINDIERGNMPYGGYGPRANFIAYDSTFHYRPILISYEIYSYIKSKTK